MNYYIGTSDNPDRPGIINGPFDTIPNLPLPPGRTLYTRIESISPHHPDKWEPVTPLDKWKAMLREVRVKQNVDYAYVRKYNEFHVIVIDAVYEDIILAHAQAAGLTITSLAVAR